MSIKDQLHTFITTNFYVGSDDELADDTSFLDAGIVDSTGVLEVIAFLEETFGIEILDEEIIPANLDSISSIASMIERKKRQG